MPSDIILLSLDFEIVLLLGLGRLTLELSNRLLTTLVLIPKFVSSGTTPKFFNTFLRFSFATATPTTFPLSLSIGPPLFPGCSAASIWMLEKLSPIPARELIIPFVTLTDVLTFRPNGYPAT